MDNLMIDLQHAKRHIEFLHGDANKEQCFQSFHDSKTTVDTLKQPATFHAKLEDSTDYFNQVQAHNYGIYITLNGTDGKGREEENIIKYSTLFVDFDNMELPRFPIQPHMVTQRDPLHSHCFFKVKGIVTGDKFKRLQKQLAIYLKSDEQVHDICRVLRLAGTYNLKDPANPAMYNIKTDYTQIVGRDHTYSLEEINTAFALQGDDLARLDKWCDSRNSYTTGEGFNDNPMYHNQLVDLASRAAPAVEGSGTMTLIKTAGYGFDLGVRLAECQQILWEVYNPRCLPVWEEHERRHFNEVVERAYKYANNEAGCKTCIGKFSAYRAAEPLPEPTGGWEADAERGRLALKGGKREATPAIQMVQGAEPFNVLAEKVDNHDIKQQVAVMMLTTNNKSSPLELAQIFLLDVFGKGNLIRSQKQFYMFNGRCWNETSDDNIRSLIMHYYSKQPKWNLKPSIIANIHITIEQLVHMEKLENDTWLDKDNINSKSVFIVLNNCLLEYSSDGKEIKHQHTNKFFCLTALPFDYLPKKQPTELLKFLGSTFENDQERISLIQEIIGYSLSKNNERQALIIFNGVSRSGKSQLTNIIKSLHGEKNVSNLQMESLKDPSSLINASKSSLIVMPECNGFGGVSIKTVVSKLKAMSGGDSLSLRNLFQSTPNEVKFDNLIIMVSNEIPDFKDPSLALAKRMIVVPFNMSFANVEDRQIQSKLTAELPAILNWALDGLRRLNHQDKFSYSKLSNNAVSDVSKDMNPLNEFIHDECDLSKKDVQTSSQELHRTYRHWCVINGFNNPLGQKKFISTMKQCANLESFQSSTGNRARGLKGISIRKIERIKPTIVNLSSSLLTKP